MASLDLSQNGPSINKSYKSLVDTPPNKNPSPTYASWAVFAVSAPLQNAFVQGHSKDSVVKVQSTGEGELSELIEEFNDGKVQFAFVKVKDSNSGLAKFVLIGWCGEGVPERVKGYFTGHFAAISKVLHGYHVQITARSESDLTPELIIQKVADASGAKYSAATSATPTPSTRPPPPTSAKPAYKPSTTTGTSRSAAYGYKPAGKVDQDGWGEDAPQITRSKLENVQSAYKPTKVDIQALKAMPTSTTSGPGRADNDRPEVVRGAYVPVGKVDIAALRAASKTKEERPEPVKGAYQPVGKVDIAAIRAQAKSKETTAEDQPKFLAERSAAFTTPPPTQAERLTSLPKPKPAKKFGAGAPSFGTKPITPGGYGHIPSAAPVGTANKDFASQGGKSPAQLWAEKKARERGEPIPSAISPTSTGSQSKTADVVEESSFSGVSAMKSKFGGVPPMGAQYSGHSGRSASPPPPPSPPQDSRPSLAGSGAIAMPGFPPRPQLTDGHASVPPPPPPQPPRSPTPPSPPTPPVPSSPVRIAMPVGRGREEEPVREPETSLPVESLSRVVPHEEDLPEEEPARERGHVAAEIHTSGGLTARVEYDYEIADTNEIDLVEGEIITNVDKVDEDWWAGTNTKGETGLFPSNYVVLIEEEVHDEPAPPPMAGRPVPAPEPELQPAAHAGPSAVAQYDYEAAEGNEISFPDGAIIEDIAFPDNDWWEGTYKGKRGLFPANYVELRE